MSNPMDSRGRAAAGASPDDGVELVLRSQKGDADAFGELVKRHQAAVFNLAYRMLNHYADAADLTQEVFVKAYRAIGGFRGQSQFPTWLHALAVNMCRNRLRRTKRIAFFESRSLDEEDPDGRRNPEAPARDGDPRENAHRGEIRAALENGLTRLPPDFAAAVVMRDVQGLSYEDIAASFGCSMGTVKSRIARGRELLSKELRPFVG